VVGRLGPARPAGSVVEGRDELAQQLTELALVTPVEPREQLPLVRKQPFERGIDLVPTSRSEPYDDPTAVPRVREAGQQPASLQPVEPIGHGAAGDQRLPEKLAGGELVRGAGAPQRREDVEGPDLEAVLGKDGPAGPGEVVREPGYPRQHMHRGDVEVGSLALPRVDQPVHLVGHRSTLATQVS
jgi:hypothetical protein